MYTLSTATLSTRTHLAPKPAQNTLNHIQRSFKVTHFGITVKRTVQGLRITVCELQSRKFRRKSLSISVFENLTVTRRPLSREPLRIFAQSCTFRTLETAFIHCISSAFHLAFLSFFNLLQFFLSFSFGSVCQIKLTVFYQFLSAH